MLMRCPTFHASSVGESPMLSQRRVTLPLPQSDPHKKLSQVSLTGLSPEGPSGNPGILVVGDYFTKWMEAYAMPHQEATIVVQKLVDEFFCHFSVPNRLHSDQGKQFESKVISAIC